VRQKCVTITYDYGTQVVVIYELQAPQTYTTEA